MTRFRFVTSILALAVTVSCCGCGVIAGAAIRKATKLLPTLGEVPSAVPANRVVDPRRRLPSEELTVVS